jgi:hypothetical protein
MQRTLTILPMIPHCQTHVPPDRPSIAAPMDVEEDYASVLCGFVLLC